MAHMSTIIDRFWRNVEKTDGCWNWTAHLNSKGYGRLWAQRKLWQAHRFSYFITHGPIPDGLFVCHRCDNPRCVRPSHLFLGTCLDNSQDMSKKGRAAWGEKCSHSKLRQIDVENIRNLHAEGISVAQIAQRYGMSRQQIYNIIDRKHWARTK